MASPTTRLTDVKASYVFSVWIEVDGRAVPVYGLSRPKEGPEGWVMSEEGKVSSTRQAASERAGLHSCIRQQYVIKYAVKPKPGTKINAPGRYGDMEISCCVDGGEGVAWGLQRAVDLRSEEGIVSSFPGREIPGNKMQRFHFSRPLLTNAPTPYFSDEKLERLGTMEIAFQRCDASACERDAGERGNKDWRSQRPINAALARSANVETVTKFGRTEDSHPPRLTCPEILPMDKNDLISFQFRHAKRETLQAMGFIPFDTAVPRSIPPPLTLHPALPSASTRQQTQETLPNPKPKPNILPPSPLPNGQHHNDTYNNDHVHAAAAASASSSEDDIPSSVDLSHTAPPSGYIPAKPIALQRDIINDDDDDDGTFSDSIDSSSAAAAAAVETPTTIGSRDDQLQDIDGVSDVVPGPPGPLGVKRGTGGGGVKRKLKNGIK
ncbi:hypothetical protein QFC19_000622 [Naganishia cerealis]|uniref:Uncharacterized protein n=1 Tax=Naganishia cerealis TaxID=610337 RepID=A0ACC2WNF6_9TREE|nr:hypothetical protein QFC19_000622 [Naganishia cerealis]